jgi:3-oxoacyl-[acyl-carrier-protein] synthase-3
VRSRIIGTGRATPPQILTNRDLEKMVDTSDQWIAERTGIRERRILDESLATSDLAAEAGQAACKKAGISPSQIDLIIVGTVTPDMPFPATACHVQRKIGAGVGPAFDVSATCAGFLYALATADGMIGRGLAKRALVIGVEVLSRIVDWTDRNTCVLFGDGAGAVVLAPESDVRRGVLSTHLYADGSFTDILCIPGGGTKLPATPEVLAARQNLVKMNGREVYKHAVRNMSAAALTALATNGIGPAGIDWVFSHQANLRIIEAVAERVNIPLDRFFLNIHKYGNTSSASLPIALDEAVEAGVVKEGQRLLFTALGGGLAWGAALVRW